jgi:DNA-binding MarR family transcriptional regulator
MVNDGLRPLGLSSAEGNVLFHLLTRGESACQEDLVAELEISKPAVSRALDGLEEAGYVERTRDQLDRRINRITLTARAESAAPAIEQVYHEVFTRAAAAVSPAEAELFIGVFRRVSDLLTADDSERRRK